MPSCVEAPISVTADLTALYREWLSLAEHLYRLAERQRDLLLSSQDGPLQAVIDEKEDLYQLTQTLSERAEGLTEARSRGLSEESPDDRDEIDGLFNHLFDRLTDLSELETESRQLLRSRMAKLGDEMGGFGHRRNLASAYGNPGGSATNESPRFLDQKR